jgi:selenocysteine lyase/cysteine desulfurase
MDLGDIDIGASFWNDIFDADKDRASSNAFQEPIHFNNAGASPSPAPVFKTVAKYMAKEALLGGYLTASRSIDELDAVYTSIARLLNTRCSGNSARDEIVLVESATVAWTRIFYSMAEALVRRSEKLAALDSDVLI